jgi:hypothetical protein
VRRILIGSLVTLTATLALNVAGASASDLLILNGDPPATLSGTLQYGIVYIDGELKLTGDTTIDAASIYIGPDASIDTCYVPGSGDGQCAGGRSLTLNSSGPLTVATGINLESGATSGPGGSLSLSGTSVAVAGQIETDGDTGFGSGSVTISSSGPIATQGIFAPGAGVSLSGHGPILVGGAIQTQGARGTTPGNPSTQMQGGGPVSITASGGDVNVGGAISTQGQGAPSAGGSGGGAGAVLISGANVYTEAISTNGGGSQESGSGPGASAPVTLTASGVLTVAGSISAAGTGGAGGTGAPAAAVDLKAGGPVTVGSVNASGAQTAAGAPITVSGTSVSAGDINASGGGGSAADRNGANAALISVTAQQGATLGQVLALGGSSDGSQSSPATPGAGAAITVASSAGSISASQVESAGGSQGVGPGANGAPLSLNAGDNLTVAGNVRADGSNAGGSWSPPWSGGNAGSLYLAADTGTLTIGGNASAKGGAGAGATNAAIGQVGGAGGDGAQVTLIAHAVGLLTSLSAAGGSGGGNDAEQGAGGPGGSLTAYTNAPILNSQQLVSTDGGDGNPTGAAGSQVQNVSPSNLTTTADGVVSFKSNSPSATRYLLEIVPASGAPTTVLKTAKTTGLEPATALCQKVTLEVVAVTSGIPWTSDPSSPISYTRQPSKSQTCAAPAKLKLPAKLDTTITRAKRAHWLETVRFHAAGIGTLKVKLTYKTLKPHADHATLTTQLTIRKAGGQVLHLRLPSTVHAAGSGTVKLTEISPDGHHRVIRTVKITIDPVKIKVSA